VTTAILNYAIILTNQVSEVTRAWQLDKTLARP